MLALAPPCTHVSRSTVGGLVVIRPNQVSFCSPRALEIMVSRPLALLLDHVPARDGRSTPPTDAGQSDPAHSNNA